MVLEFSVAVKALDEYIAILGKNFFLPWRSTNLIKGL
jgi:hypothetical protein